MLTPEIMALAQRSVLCWLATADAQGQPNVSPKEMFCLLPPTSLAIANIASPASVRNVLRNGKVCVSFVDVFAQKGCKLFGNARVILPADPEYSRWAEPLLAMVGTRFKVQSVIAVDVTAVEPIIAPSYIFYPGEATEEKQISSAMQSYGVRPGNA